MDAEQIVHDVAERVRAVIAEAEERAAAIVRDAEAEAKDIRARAEEDAHKRLDEVQRAVTDLQSKLGGSAPADAQPAGNPSAEVTPEPVTVPEPAPPDTPEPIPDPVPEPIPGPERVPEPTPEPVPEPAPGEPPEPEAAQAPEPSPDGNGGARNADKAAARLVAMKMALDGASRDEIDAHLAANYDVENREKLLDDVLARAKA